MAWLKIDDGFAFHPKVGMLSRADRWTWMEVMCHCATQRTGGRIPRNITELYRYVTPRFLARAEAAGLIDRVGGMLHVHDWDVYNGGSLEERVAAYLAGKPLATANEVHNAVGGKREIVLALVAQVKQASQNSGSQGGSQEPEGNWYPVVPGTGTTPVHHPDPTEEQGSGKSKSSAVTPTSTLDAEQQNTKNGTHHFNNLADDDIPF